MEPLHISLSGRLAPNLETSTTKRQLSAQLALTDLSVHPTAKTPSSMLAERKHSPMRSTTTAQSPVLSMAILAVTDLCGIPAARSLFLIRREHCSHKQGASM